jgi:protein PhnA
MNNLQELQQRSNNLCELCTSSQSLKPYEVAGNAESKNAESIYICEKCTLQLEKKEELDYAHWNCINTCMWSEVPAVQVTSWRMLHRLKSESWALDALDILYLDDENLAWAKATGEHESNGDVDLHRDCNGAQLLAGDSVVLIKSLDVKGSTLNAKLGTVVKNIRLVQDNTEQIEGKIEGQTIVILTKYVRKN